MRKERLTLFISSEDNAACAKDFAAALAEEGIKSTVCNQNDGSADVSYKCDDARFSSLLPLMIEIEKGYSKPGDGFAGVPLPKPAT